jgi:hypothetical protein
VVIVTDNIALGQVALFFFLPVFMPLMLHTHSSIGAGSIGAFEVAVPTGSV